MPEPQEANTPTFLMTVDAAVYAPKNPSPDDFTPEYHRRLMDGEQIPAPGDVLLYELNGELQHRFVRQRVFSYQGRHPGSVILFVADDPPTLVATVQSHSV